MKAVWSSWLVERALPLWDGAGFDQKVGLYRERLTFEGAPVAVPALRLMVQMRQVATFCRAALDGYYQAADRALGCLERARRLYYRADGQPGWAFALDEAGQPAYSERDLYTHAFVLYAHAWAYGVCADPAILQAARQTKADIDSVFNAADGEVLGAARNALGMYEQNPRMHLIEAYLALFEVSGDACFLDSARVLVMLALERMVDPVTGMIAEVFTPQWQAVAVHGAVRFEPGHQVEWAWLLLEFLRLSPGEPCGEAIRAAALRLGAAGWRAWQEGKGFLCDAVSASGTVIEGAQRIWPQTETIRLWCDYGLIWPEASVDILSAMTVSFFGRFALLELDGGWVDHVNAQGRAMVEYMPASSLYHIYGAARSIAQFSGREPSYQFGRVSL
jgi:mannose/cellobiose epimerase-like protein (N-acyl-D-glucosamine 2-epimerase family)